MNTFCKSSSNIPLPYVKEYPKTTFLVTRKQCCQIGKILQMEVCGIGEILPAFENRLEHLAALQEKDSVQIYAEKLIQR